MKLFLVCVSVALGACSCTKKQGAKGGKPPDPAADGKPANGKRPSRNAQYGVACFNYLKRHYPQHFTLRSRDGNPVSISENDPMGKFVIAAFSEKTPSGWLHCAGRPPYKYANSECLFYETLVVGHDGVEILLGRGFDAKDSPSEKFWMAIFFEAFNALRGREFLSLADRLGRNEITREDFTLAMMRIEYQSARRVKSNQEQRWRTFCHEHDIAYSGEPWFFDPDTTFDQWLEGMRSNETGRRYLAYYETWGSSPSSKKANSQD